MKAAFREIADDMLRLVEKKQLKDRALWELAAGQFAGTPDDIDLGWRGEYWGKLMRGACMTWQYTRDEELYGILKEATEKLLSAQEADGRISTYSREKEFRGWDMWCRKYVLLGLIHFSEICKEEDFRARIVEAAGRHLDYIIAHVGEGEGKICITRTSDIWKGINSSSILEPVVRLYQVKPEKRYLEFADYIVENGGAEGFDIFQAAYDDVLYPYQYPVVKAYELMSCFEGLLVYAQVKQSAKWKQAVVRFADRLLESEATIVGGSGCKHELFNHSALMQTGTGYDGLMLETCVTVTWMKLMYRVYGMTGELRFLEEVEKSAFNALYGAVNTKNSTCGPETTFDEPSYRGVYDHAVLQDGGNGQMFDSYSPLRSGIRGRAIGGFKSMGKGLRYCGCCIAIGAAGTALTVHAAARELPRGVEFDLYLPGKIEAMVEGMPVEFFVESNYPAGGEISITVLPQEEKEFEVALRIPSYMEAGTIAVNGEVCQKAEPGTLGRLCRNWKKGDCIRLSLHWKPRLVFGMENPEDPESRHHVAVLYGPLVLAREKRLGEEGTPVRLREGKVSLKEAESAPFTCQCCFDVTLDGAAFRMIDYASAGKTWRRDSEMEAWLRTC